MIHYQLKLSYKGTNYSGWQIQNQEITIQGTLNSVLSEIFKSSQIKSVGSGRTDAGVHALGQVVRIDAPFEIEPSALQRGLNSLLPNDIRVLDCHFCDKKFRPTNDAIKKEYFYLFSNYKTVSPFQNDFLANVSFDLDLKAMELACTQFFGEHNFSDFQCTGTEVASSIREIYECSIQKIEKQNFHDLMPDHYKITVVGNGFLKQMVRLMVGCVWSFGQGKVSKSQLQAALNSPTGQRLGIVAPAQGLYLSKVYYNQ